MKRILNIVLCVLVAVSLFTFSASADEAILLGGKDETVVFSDDYTHLGFEKESYTIIDDSNISYDSYYYDDDVVTEIIALTEEQKKTVSSLELTVYKKDLLLDAEYKLNTGVEICATYINDKYLDKFKKASNGEVEDVRVYFGYPDNNQFETTITKLKENKATKKALYWGIEEFDVYIDVVENAENNISIISGKLILSDDIYYYLDYKDAGIKSSEELEEFYENEKECTVYEITDPDIIWGLENCYNLRNGDLGLLSDEDITAAFASVLATIVFAVLPLAVLVLSVIFGIRFKEKYRKLFFTLGGIALAEIIVFAILKILI